MFCPLNGATFTPWRTSHRQMPHGDDALPGIGRGPCHQQSATTHDFPLRNSARPATHTPRASQLTRRESRAARSTSAVSTDRPDAFSTGRFSTRPPYDNVPPSRTPSAPANEASTTPALGLGCSRASSRHAVSAPRGRPPATAASTPVSRAPGQLYHVVEARGRPAVTAVPGRLVPDHGVQGVHGAEGDEPGDPGDGAPHERAHDGVGGVLGYGLDDGPRDPVRVQGLRVTPAQMRQPLACRVHVTGGQRAPDGARLAPQRRTADHSPGGGGGQCEGGGGGAAHGARGEATGDGGAPGAHGGVQRAPPAVVAPQHSLDGARGPPERGDRMPAARIAEQEVTEESGGAAVREDALGSHGQPAATANGTLVLVLGGSTRNWQPRMAICPHSGCPRPGWKRPAARVPGSRGSLPGDSGGTAPDSHRLPLLLP